MIVIPARLGSTRFENKILVNINGLPMVIATANRVKDIDEVVIATNSEDVVSLAKKHGYRAFMTSSNHQSGTDRINEVATILKLSDDELIINVQADEPFIEKEIIFKLHKKLLEMKKDKKDFIMASCAKSISFREANDPHLVKVILNSKDEAIYFSRSLIPYSRDTDFDGYLGHLGIYGFCVKSLREFCSLDPSSLELSEKLEQLRAIQNTKPISMIKVKSKSFGIDTQEDLTRALKELS